MQGYTGVVGILKTKNPGPVTAFRFDIDALNNIEAKEKGHRPYDEGFVSVNEGYMHACGHDGHTAIGLGLAEVLMKMRDELCGTIKLFFQPSEEGGGGARAMVASGIADDVNYLFTGHIGLAHNGVPLNSHSIAGGCNDFLDNRRYDITFIGKAAHPCGDPHKGKNALLAACTAALNIHAIAPHGEGLSRVNVGVLNAGVSRNTIAPTAFLQIEARGDSDETAEYMEQRVLCIIKSTAQMYGLEYETKFMGSTPSAKSDKELVDVVLKTASTIEWFKEFHGEGNVGGSDDASEWMRKVQSNGGKATYIGLGADFAASFHNNYFDFDEGVLMPSVELFYKLAKEVCEKSEK
jgi:aminobenzoyl-glutamate utilization protein A